MSNGSVPPAPANGGKPSDDSKLDIGVLNNGVKLVGEALVPGASLLLEKHIGAGLLLGSAGLLGGAALGAAFGPLGYLLARYGASALSFSQSLQQPPPATPANGALVTATVNTNKAVQALAQTVQAQAQTAQANTEAMRETLAMQGVLRSAQAAQPVAPAFTAAPVAPAFTAAPTDIIQETNKAVQETNRVVQSLAGFVRDTLEKNIEKISERLDQLELRSTRPATKPA